MSGVDAQLVQYARAYRSSDGKINVGDIQKAVSSYQTSNPGAGQGSYSQLYNQCVGSLDSKEITKNPNLMTAFSGQPNQNKDSTLGMVHIQQQDPYTTAQNYGMQSNPFSFVMSA